MDVVRIVGPVGAGGDEERPDAARIETAPTAADLPLVLVTWRDAWFDFDGDDASEGRSDYLVTTVGFVLKDGPRFLSIAQEILPDGDGFRAVTHIPRSVVESIVPVGPVPEPQLGLYSTDPDAARASGQGRRDA